MKKEFSTSWNSSKQPRKQRKYRANAPLHLKKKFVNVNLSKELRKKHEKRNLALRKGDVVKIMRGKFKNKNGKILEIKLKTSKIIIEGIQTKKNDGSKVNVKMQPSNLQIIELNLEDRKRIKKLGIKEEKKEVKKEEPETKLENKKSESKIKTTKKKVEGDKK
jgi:large subunit ribosomal protein L24